MYDRQCYVSFMGRASGEVLPNNEVQVETFSFNLKVFTPILGEQCRNWSRFYTWPHNFSRPNVIGCLNVYWTSAASFIVISCIKELVNGLVYSKSAICIWSHESFLSMRTKDQSMP